MRNVIGSEFSKLGNQIEEGFEENAIALSQGIQSLTEKIEKTGDSILAGQEEIGSQLDGINERLERMEKTLAEIQKTVQDNNRMLKKLTSSFFKKKSVIDDIYNGAGKMFKNSQVEEQEQMQLAGMQTMTAKSLPEIAQIANGLWIHELCG